MIPLPPNLLLKNSESLIVPVQFLILNTAINNKIIY